jgi:hypothetical protein
MSDLVERMRAMLQRGRDTRQLAVPIDLEDLEKLIQAADADPWFGCFSGDCPHQTQSECDAAIRKEFARLEAENVSTEETVLRNAIYDRTIGRNGMMLVDGREVYYRDMLVAFGLEKIDGWQRSEVTT